MLSCVIHYQVTLMTIWMCLRKVNSNETAFISLVGLLRGFAAV